MTESGRPAAPDRGRPREPRLVTGLQPVREAIRVHGERLEEVLVIPKGAGKEHSLEQLRTAPEPLLPLTESPPTSQVETPP